jgi:hypothetical protein
MTDTKVHPKPTARFVTVTPKVAHEWLSKNRKNRNLRPSKVDRIARDIVAGRYMVTGEAAKFDWNGNLIDGQHRCAAILKADTPVHMLVVYGLDPASQDVMDTGAARSSADMLGLNGKQHTAITAASIKLILNWQAGNIRSSASTLTLSPTHAEILAFADVDPTISWAAARAQHFYGMGLSVRPSVLAFCLWLTGRRDAPAANSFFESLAEMTTDGIGDPRYALLRRLHTMKDERTTQVMEAWVVIRAWNAWRADERMEKVQIGSRGKPSPFPEVHP